MEQLGLHNQQPVYIEQYESIALLSTLDVTGSSLLLWFADTSWAPEGLQVVVERCISARAPALALAGERAEECFAVLFDVIETLESEPQTALSVFADREMPDILREFLGPAPETSSTVPPQQVFRLVVVGAPDLAATFRAALVEHVRRVIAGI